MKQATRGNRLGSCRVCHGLNDAEIQRIAASVEWRDLQPDEELTWPRDSLVALYTVTRGRLRMFLDRHGAAPEFVGYVNQGETVGQATLLAGTSGSQGRIVADLPSEVAVLGRTQALRLILQIPEFRNNLIASFGVRLEFLLEGKKLRRNLRVVGIVAADAAAVSFLPDLCQQLEDAGERPAVLTARPAAFARLSQTTTHALPDDEAGLRTAISQLLPRHERVLMDLGPYPPATGTTDPARQIEMMFSECEELLWCLDDHQVDGHCSSLLEQLVQDHPGWRTRIVGVRIIAEGATSRHHCHVCDQLVHRDLLLPLTRTSKRPLSLWQQGMDRIVRHLKGVRIGLALGGGGARGMAHLGVLKTLEEAGISFDEMSGTSSGALVGIGYAAGLPVDGLIESFAAELQPTSWLERIPGGRRLYVLAQFRARSWETMLRKYYQEWTFEQLPMPFSAVVTDLVSGDQVIRDSGDVVEAILESINVPVLSEPLMKNGRILVDGGVLNNLPVELLSDRGAEFVIGVDASKEIPNTFAGNRQGMKTSQMKKPGRVETAARVMDVSRRGIARLQMTFADVVIEPDTSAFDFADFSAAPRIAETGVEATHKVLDRIRQEYQQLMGSAARGD
jgi:predicted acylesterase/phospholipase RssA/CRP-like cAMP-binding protein